MKKAFAFSLALLNASLFLFLALSSRRNQETFKIGAIITTESPAEPAVILLLLEEVKINRLRVQ